MKPPLKHRDLSRALLGEIASGKHAPGTRLPSEAALVTRFGVSRPTVGRALRDLQAEGLIERRAGSGTYVRAASVAPQSGSSKLGLLVPALGTTEIFDLICGELAGLARAQDHALLWEGSTLSHHDADLTVQEALAISKRFIEQRVRGVFFAPFEMTAGQEKANNTIAERFRSAGIPVILLDRDLAPFPQRSGFDLVGIDNFAAGYLAAEHLIKLGARHLAFLGRPSIAPTVDARIAGAREALLRHSLDTPRTWIQTGDPADARFVRLLTAARRWDGFICANDLAAAHLLRSLEKNHVRVPTDVRVVGFDDAKYASLLGISLTTIHQPTRGLALTAWRAMLERIADPSLPARSLLLTPRLVVRESCGAYLPKA